MDTKSPLAGLFASRKGVLTLLVLIMATAYAALVCVSAARGAITMDVALTRLEAAFGVFALIVGVHIFGIAQEDSAQKAQPTIEAISGTELVSEPLKPVINLTVHATGDASDVAAKVAAAVDGATKAGA